MGFFGGNYNKPGKGVKKNEPEKPAIFTMFAVYFRKFWNLVTLNLLYVLTNAIPIFVIAPLVGYNVISDTTLNPNDPDQIFLLTIIGCILVALGVVTIGPFQAGFTYVLRNYSQERHAFIWRDFIDCAKANLKQGLIVCVIDLVLILALTFNIAVIPTMTDLPSFYVNMLSSVNWVVLIFFAIAHLYIYQIMITFKVSVFEIYKISFMMVFSNFSSSLIMFMFPFLIVGGCFFSYEIGLLLTITIMFSTVAFFYNFYVNRKIRIVILENRYKFKMFEDLKDRQRGDV